MSKETAAGQWPIEIVRSHRRRKSVQAELKNGTLVVRAPAHMSDADLAPLIAKLAARMEKRKRKRPVSDDALDKCAQQLNRDYFDGQFKWQSIQYVSNQKKRYGSCTPSLGTIRISDRLLSVPQWVHDYVVVHELCHLAEANHGPRFWALVNRYPLTERARGYLMALDLEEIDDEVSG